MFPTSPHVQAELFKLGRRLPSDVKECFCNESDVRGPAGIHFWRLRYSKSNLTARSKVPSAAGSSLSQSRARCVELSHLTLPVFVLSAACLS